MADNTTIANLGDLAQPATALVEKVSEAVGGIFRPYQIVRVAKAEAEAEKIKALAGVEITEIQQRGLTRMIVNEGKKQENIESITAQAIPLLGEDAKPEEVEDDWIANFFEKCKHVSDREMQSLWSKILAGEANKAGTFSKRTVETVAQLDKADAQLFTNFCSYVWMWDGLIPFIYEPAHEIYMERGITFVRLVHLDDIGLITFSDYSGFKKLLIPREILLHYYGTPIYVQFPQEQNNELDAGKVILTKIGTELAPLCGSKKLDGYLEYVIGKWISKGLKVSSPLLNNPKAVPPDAA